MGYAAVALAVLGAVIGLTSRLKMLLWVVAVLLFGSTGLAIFCGFDLRDSFLMVMAAQAILQGSYLLALVIKSVLNAIRARSVL
jgi:hypothetical protein